MEITRPFLRSFVVASLSALALAACDGGRCQNVDVPAPQVQFDPNSNTLSWPPVENAEYRVLIQAFNGPCDPAEQNFAANNAIRVTDTTFDVSSYNQCNFCYHYEVYAYVYAANNAECSSTSQSTTQSPYFEVVPCEP